MAHRIPHRQALCWVEDEKLPHKIDELPIHDVKALDNVSYRLGRLDLLSALFARLAVGPGDARACRRFLEKLGLAAGAGARKFVRHATHDLLHHRQMLEVIVRLEECHAGVELDKDTPEGESITGV